MSVVKVSGETPACERTTMLATMLGVEPGQEFRVNRDDDGHLVDGVYRIIAVSEEEKDE